MTLEDTKTLKLCTSGSAYLKLRLDRGSGDPVLEVLELGAETEKEPFSTDIRVHQNLHDVTWVWGTLKTSVKIGDKIAAKERTLRIEIEHENGGPKMEWALTKPGALAAQILETCNLVTTAILPYPGREAVNCECTLLEVGAGLGAKAKTIILPEPSCPTDKAYEPS